MTTIEFVLLIKKEDGLDGPPVWTVEATDTDPEVMRSFTDAFVSAICILAEELKEQS